MERKTFHGSSQLARPRLLSGGHSRAAMDSASSKAGSGVFGAPTAEKPQTLEGSCTDTNLSCAFARAIVGTYCSTGKVYRMPSICRPLILDCHEHCGASLQLARRDAPCVLCRLQDVQTTSVTFQQVKDQILRSKPTCAGPSRGQLC